MPKRRVPPKANVMARDFHVTGCKRHREARGCSSKSHHVYNTSLHDNTKLKIQLDICGEIVRKTFYTFCVKTATYIGYDILKKKKTEDVCYIPVLLYTKQ